jgi:large repetitive protein
LTPGTTYKFRVQARNTFGLSVYSDVVTLLCAFVPAAPSEPTTTVIGNNVIINWSAPSSNGSPITSYRIKIRKHDGLYAEELSYCDGQKSSIISVTQCNIPLLNLEQIPFSLVLGDSVVAIVTATNTYGESLDSVAGNGGSILQIPDAPVDLLMNDPVTTASVIGFTWSDGSSTGGTTIIDYRVWYDQSTGQYVILESGVLTKSYQTTVTLTAGATYKFKV